MSDRTENGIEAPKRDNWLSAVFAAAAGPVIDMAFVDRVLARMRKRERVRILVIVGTMIGAGALTLWQLSGLAATVPAFETVTLKAPNWLVFDPMSSIVLIAALVVGLTAWMATEEA